MYKLALLATLALIGCGDKDDGNGEGEGTGGGDDTGTGGGGAAFEDFINVTEAPIGDLTSFAGGYEAEGAWFTQTVNPDAVSTTYLRGTLDDFESGNAVDGADVEIWYSDSISGVADVKTTTDSNGEFTVDNVPTCAPMSTKTSTDPELDKTKDTYEAHQIYSPGESVDDEYNSVSTTTYRLIPSLLGVTIDADKAIVAGTSFDANEDPILGSQVVVRDANGNIPESLTVKYFREEFPNRDQPYTSEDGLWVAMNIPQGDYTVEMYVSDGAGGHLLMGATQLQTLSDSINVSNIYLGYGDGIKYPTDCVSE